LQGFLIPLYPLHRAFKLKNIIVVTMQAVSGAGYPGIASLDIIDNIIPYIAGEEEKSEIEPLKILGSIQNEEISSITDVSISMHCNRVPVLDGHTACVSVQFEKKPTKDEILTLWREFRGIPQELHLPSAPEHPIIYNEEKDRPQPRRDRDAEGGMAITVGRLRECHVFDFRFACLSHNVLRGAARGGVLNAELLHAQGYV
jgi:aspartate-semialdehyde dehydrogenase